MRVGYTGVVGYVVLHFQSVVPGSAVVTYSIHVT
jgi:hypothetical protein